MCVRVTLTDDSDVYGKGDDFVYEWKTWWHVVQVLYVGIETCHYCQHSYL